MTGTSLELSQSLNFNKFETTNEFYYPLYTYQSGPETLHHVVSLFTRFGWLGGRGFWAAILIGLGLYSLYRYRSG